VGLTQAEPITVENRASPPNRPVLEQRPYKRSEISANHLMYGNATNQEVALVLALVGVLFLANREMGQRLDAAVYGTTLAQRGDHVTRNVNVRRRW
jgi:hypothetical protein